MENKEFEEFLNKEIKLFDMDLVEFLRCLAGRSHGIYGESIRVCDDLPYFLSKKDSAFIPKYVNMEIDSLDINLVLSVEGTVFLKEAPIADINSVTEYDMEIVRNGKLVKSFLIIDYADWLEPWQDKMEMIRISGGKVIVGLSRLHNSATLPIDMYDMIVSYYIMCYGKQQIAMIDDKLSELGYEHDYTKKMSIEYPPSLVEVLDENFISDEGFYPPVEMELISDHIRKLHIEEFDRYDLPYHKLKEDKKLNEFEQSMLDDCIEDLRNKTTVDDLVALKNQLQKELNDAVLKSAINTHKIIKEEAGEYTCALFDGFSLHYKLTP